MSEVRLESVDIAQILASLLHSGSEGLLAFAHPDTRVVVLLVRLVFTFGITDLSFEITSILDDKVLCGKKM
jgi:hypothetical protein